jgi:septum formation protein
MANSVHRITTAVALISVADQNRVLKVTTVSEVEFGAVTEAEMHHYWATGEPKDKSGAYAIQGHAGCWVKSIRGSVSGIVGLPQYETKKLLAQAGFLSG